MPTWLVKKGSNTEELSEYSLRAKLRKRELSGTELARQEDERTWAPLHELPIFTEEVAFVGDPRTEAWRRQCIGFGWHLTTFVATAWFLGFPWWLSFWGVFVAGHLLRTLPALAGLLRPPRSTPPKEPLVAEARTLSDPFVFRLEALLQELDDAGESVELIRQDAMALHERWLALSELSSGIDLEDLQDELARSEAMALAAAGSPGAESYARELDAIRERLGILQESAEVQARIAARERELLHRLESVRLSIRRSRLEDDDPARSTEQITEIQRRLAAEVEVNEQLARARRAARKQRQ